MKILRAFFLFILSASAYSDSDNERFAAQGYLDGEESTVHLTIGGGGKIRSLLGSTSEVVKAGVLLAEAECPDIRGRINSLSHELSEVDWERKLLVAGARDEEVAVYKAEYLQAKSSLVLEESKYLRLVNLKDKGDFVSDNEVDDSKNRVKVAETAVQKSEKSLALIEAPARVEDLEIINSKFLKIQSQQLAAQELLASDCQIIAPYNGVVLKQHMEPGEWVNPLTPEVVVSYGSLSTLIARVEVDEKDILKVTVGQPVMITSQATGDKKFEGHVTSIDKEVGIKSIHSKDANMPVDRDVLEVKVIIDDQGLPKISGLRVLVIFQG
jgi:multidrug resistance efflux pump